MSDWQDHLRSTLQTLPLRSMTDPHRGEAAVLVSILARKEPAFLLTKRSQRVATHKGHVSFPGGMQEAGDADLASTALRETHEELGIAPAAVELVGGFHEYMAATGHRVTPFVGLLPPRPAVALDTGEVEDAFEVPFEFFFETPPRVEEVVWRGSPHNLYYYDYDGDVVWGLTAAIIRDLLKVLEPGRLLV